MWKIFDWIIYQIRLLRHRPRLLWHRLWIRKNEFHRSLSMDVDALLVMNESDRIAYMEDLIRRRNIAHKRDLVN